MKKLRKLKLNELNKADLEKKEMSMITGGCSSGWGCGCGCVYAGTPGGSSYVDNSLANEFYGDNGGINTYI